MSETCLRTAGAGAMRHLQYPARSLLNPADFTQEMAAVSSVEHSTAELCNTDAKLSHVQGKSGFEEVIHHSKSSSNGKKVGKAQGGGLAASRQLGRVVEVTRKAPATAVRRRVSDMRVLTVARLRTRSSQ